LAKAAGRPWSNIRCEQDCVYGFGFGRQIIVKEAADTVKRVTLELGGKSPNIFLPMPTRGGNRWRAVWSVHQSGRSLFRGQPHPGAEIDL